MSIVYNGMHSLTFVKLNEYGDAVPSPFSGWVDDDYVIGVINVNTWEQLHLVPVSRPFVEVAQPRIQFVNIPRSNRILDLTNVFTRDVTYEAREGDWEFYIDHDRWTDWTEAYDAISDWFDGSIFDVNLNYTTGYTTYHGRIYISKYSPDSDFSRITFHYSLDVESTIHEWVLANTYSGRLYNVLTNNNVTRYHCTGGIDIGTNDWVTLRITLTGNGLNKNYSYYVLRRVHGDPSLRITLLENTSEEDNKIEAICDLNYTASTDDIFVGTTSSQLTGSINCKVERYNEETTIY